MEDRRSTIEDLWKSLVQRRRLRRVSLEQFFDLFYNRSAKGGP
jgi:hypothetical protein